MGGKFTPMAIKSRRAGSKTKRIAQERLYRLLWDQTLESDDLFLDRARRLVPEAWHMIEMDVDVSEPKEKLTLYLDRSVARMFKAMGQGYQARINRILATWVQMQIADVKALEMDYIDALEATRGQRDAEAPVDMRDRRTKALEEHWAYLQGVLDQERWGSKSDR